ncbi:MAG: hypothetical protein JNM47_07050 [Hyphomonadaceae bacterium]|nr:hypothetical protein [Hyphomonadaceae bacterium]
MALFKVDHCFVLESRSIFVLAGEITEGQIRLGMKIRLGAADDADEVEIFDLEFVRFTDRRPEAETAVCLRWDSDEQLASFRALNLAGQTLSVS